MPHGELFETEPKQEHAKKENSDFADERLFDMEFCKAEAEKRCLAHALAAAKGNKTHAAELLSMNLRTFHRYCAKYNVILGDYILICSALCRRGIFSCSGT